MSSLDRMTLEIALPIIQNIYSSIAIKTMILKQKDEWINIFTLILPTRRTKSDLNDEFLNLEKRIGKIDFPNFKIIFQSHDIEDLSRIINEIEKGFLTIGELNTKFMQDTSKIKRERFGRSSYNLRYGELLEYESYSLKSGVQQTVINTLIGYSISPGLFSLGDFNDIARSWFQVDTFSEAITVLILIPVYAKVISILYEGGNAVKIEIKIDQDIIKKANLLVTRKGGQDRGPIIERKFYDIFSLNHIKNENFYFVQLEHVFQGINANDIIEATIQHEELGLISKNDLRMRFITDAPEYPLMDAFNLFDAKKLLNKNLIDPADKNSFEKAVYWFLELIGFHTIRLENGEIIRENNVNKGSADIIFYDDESKTMYIIDCTIGVPPPNKIDKIRNTSNYISRQYKFAVKPIIFTSTICPTVKSNAKLNEVKIIDKENINELYGTLQLGYLHIPKARRQLTNE